MNLIKLIWLFWTVDVNVLRRATCWALWQLEKNHNEWRSINELCPRKLEVSKESLAALAEDQQAKMKRKRGGSFETPND